MSKIFAIMSGKGGVGKSTISTALATYFAEKGMRTVLIDGDIGLRCADLMLDLQDQVVYDLGDLAEGRCTRNQALLSPADLPELSLLAAPQLMKPSDLKSKEMARIVEKISVMQDIIIIDAPAGIGRGLKNLLGVDSTPVIVATPDDISVRDAERLGILLSDRGEMHPCIIFNRVNPVLVRRGEMTSPQALAESLDMPLVGIVPESPEIYRALLRHENVLNCGDPNVYTAIENIASRLLGAETPLPEYTLSPLWRFFSRGGDRR